MPPFKPSPHRVVVGAAQSRVQQGVTVQIVLRYLENLLPHRIRAAKIHIRGEQRQGIPVPPLGQPHSRKHRHPVPFGTVGTPAFHRLIKVIDHALHILSKSLSIKPLCIHGSTGHRRAQGARDAFRHNRGKRPIPLVHNAISGPLARRERVWYTEIRLLCAERRPP